MKAVVYASKGGPEVVEWRDVPDPRPQRGEVLVRVSASAMNRADLLQRRGLYPPPPGWREDIPGLELAGEVVEVGPDVTAFRAGDRVTAIASGEAHAELAIALERMLVPVPESLSWEDAGAVMVITADEQLRGGKQLPLKAIVDEAIGAYLAGDKRPALPRALVPVVQRRVAWS